MSALSEDEELVIPSDDAESGQESYVSGVLPERRRTALAKFDSVALVAVGVIGVFIAIKLVGFLVGTLLLAVKVAVVVGVAALVWRLVTGSRRRR